MRFFNLIRFAHLKRISEAEQREWNEPGWIAGEIGEFLEGCSGERWCLEMNSNTLASGILFQNSAGIFGIESAGGNWMIPTGLGENDSCSINKANKLIKFNTEA